MLYNIFRRMNALQIILTIVIALLGYPAGLIISWLADDELKAGKVWFKTIIIASIIAIVISIIFVQGELLLFLSAAFVFIALMALASIIKSRKLGKWWKKRK